MTNFVPFAARPAGMIPRRGFMLGVAGLLATAGRSRRAAGQDAAEQIATPWIKDLHSALGLIAGGRRDGVMSAGIAIRLDPGWKTYWRTPGDSGVPPRFDFSASDNVADVTVSWPAPRQFPDGAGGISFGYHDEVVLPLRIVAKAPNDPVTLRAQINYAVCEKLCIPVEARAEFTSLHPSAPDNPSLEAARALVPRHAGIGADAAFGIRSVKRDGATVTVEVVAPPQESVELFVEGPAPDWALPPPALRATEPGGLRRFSFALEGLPPQTRADGAVLKLTLAGAGRACDYDVTLE